MPDGHTVIGLKQTEVAGGGWGCLYAQSTGDVIIPGTLR